MGSHHIFFKIAVISNQFVMQSDISRSCRCTVQQILSYIVKSLNVFVFHSLYIDVRFYASITSMLLLGLGVIDYLVAGRRSFRTQISIFKISSPGV